MRHHFEHGLAFRQEYFADGVRPRGIHVLSDILKKAFSDVEITDVRYEAIVS